MIAWGISFPTQFCPGCRGRQRVVGVFDESTKAYWQPCSICSPEELTRFQQAPENVRLKWFSRSEQHKAWWKTVFELQHKLSALFMGRKLN